jgi:hypothetical protein
MDAGQVGARVEERRGARAACGPKTWGKQDAKPRSGWRHEAVRLPGAADAARATRPVAIPSLALSRRPALACACAPGQALVFERARTFDGRPAGLQPATAGRLTGWGERGTEEREEMPIPAGPTRRRSGPVGVGGPPGAGAPAPEPRPVRRSTRSRRSGSARWPLACRDPCPRCSSVWLP